MKLYEVPKNTWVNMNGYRVLFHHIDGMYSLCETEDGRIFHPVAWTEVSLWV